MKQFFLILVVILAMTSCKKEKKVTEPLSPKTSDTKSDTQKNNPMETKEEQIPCEVLFQRHGKCLFQIADTNKIYNIPLGKSPRKGAAEPLVTLVEFSEFQCPACKVFATKVIPEILKKYDGKIQIVYKHYPLDFHEYALIAAVVAEEVRAQKGDENFWKFHDMVYENQEKLSPEFLNETASKLGVDMTKLQKVVMDENNPHKARIKEDADLGDKVGVEGTPFVYVNGELFSPENEDLMELIDRQIAKAQAAVNAGTPLAKLYTYLVDHGQTVFETPVSKEEQEKLLKSKEAFFLEKCKGKNPQMEMFVKMLSACSKTDIACDAFMQCVESKVRQQMPEDE